jgi:hypothetical protein
MRDMEKIPPGKALPAHAPRCATPRWLVPAALLVLLAAAVALAIALPVALKRRAQSNRAYQPLADARADGSVPDQMLAGAERTYYVAADPVEWDYAPSGRNLCKGKDFDKEEQLYVQAGAGRKFQKAVFREYTDNTFKVGRSGHARSHSGLPRWTRSTGYRGAGRGASPDRRATPACPSAQKLWGCAQASGTQQVTATCRRDRRTRRPQPCSNLARCRANQGMARKLKGE